MMERFYELKDAVSLLLSQPFVSEELSHFGTEKWSEMDQAAEVLRPLYQAANELSGEKHSAASKIIPLAKQLMGFFASIEREASQGTFKKNLAKLILKFLYKI